MAGSGSHWYGRKRRKLSGGKRLWAAVDWREIKERPKCEDLIPHFQVNFPRINSRDGWIEVKEGSHLAPLSKEFQPSSSWTKLLWIYANVDLNVTWFGLLVGFHKLCILESAGKSTCAWLRTSSPYHPNHLLKNGPKLDLRYLNFTWRYELWILDQKTRRTSDEAKEWACNSCPA